MSKQQWGHGYWSGVVDGVKARFDFREYCLIRPKISNEDSIITDFVNDVQRDAGFPTRNTEESLVKYKSRIWKHVHGIVNGRLSRPCRDAEAALARLWGEWRGL